MKLSLSKKKMKKELKAVGLEICQIPVRLSEKRQAVMVSGIFTMHRPLDLENQVSKESGETGN